MGEVTGEVVGRTAGGEAVRRVVLRSGEMAVALLTHGARLRDLRLGGVPLTLGTEALAPYEGPMGSVGGLVAPVVNRISGAAGVLDGERVALEENGPGLTLHSASGGTHRKVWTLEEASEAHALMAITLPHGEAGFPGERRLTALWETFGHALTLTVEAATDRPTWINAANHSYWRLGGTGIEDHRLRVAADRVLVTDPEGLPTGEVAEAEGPFDLREGRGLEGERYDDSFCVAEGRRALTPVAWLEGPAARMELSTTEPGLQVYTGDKLRDFGVPDHSGRAFGPRAGLALEAQGWPDAMNHEGWPSVRLDPGETSVQVTRWSFA